MSNTYSQTWFDTCLHQIPIHVTDAEVPFLRRVLPLPDYQRLLDLCCGPGRHAVPLTRNGYVVTGMDRDATALRHAEAKLRGTAARFIDVDVRDQTKLPAPFDAALVMWQSFGYFDPDTNLRIPSQIARALRPRGRLVLDLYHRALFEGHVGTPTLESGGRHVEETRWMDGNRLHVILDYGGGDRESMEWQLFYLEEIVSIAQGVGFRPAVVCSRWDEDAPAFWEFPRMQIVIDTVTP